MHLAYDTYRAEWQLKSPFKVLKGLDAETPNRFTQNRVTPPLPRLGVSHFATNNQLTIPTESPWTESPKQVFSIFKTGWKPKLLQKWITHVRERHLFPHSPSKDLPGRRPKTSTLGSLRTLSVSLLSNGCSTWTLCTPNLIAAGKTVN